jgi:hypothetical protein
MSDYWEVISLNPEGISAREAVYGIHQIITELGGYIDEDCFLALQDTETISPDVENIIDVHSALHRLSRWYTLGAIEYVLYDKLITIEYAGLSGKYTVQFVKLTIQEDINLSISLEVNKNKQRYIELAQKIHQKLQSIRTILDWNIGFLYSGDLYNQEMERLKHGDFAGNYLLDIRTTE